MADERLEQWLSTATIQEKAALLAGRDFWSMRGIEAIDVPPLVLTDGPHGVRLQATSGESLDAGVNEPATCFPTAATLASTWDPALVERVGEALGEESRALGVSVLLGPGANIKRTPLCGRNFEYFSEDPLLSSAMAVAWIRGVQSQGVGASLKHFAVNNQETLRFSVDAVVDERALREIYLASFEQAVVDAEPMTVMAAYNRVDGDYATESPFLLQQVLRDEWGFDGVVMSDWGATDDRVAALQAGLDLQMPGVGDCAAPIVEAVREGRLDVAVVDRAIRRLVALAERTAGARERVEIDVDAHQRLSEDVAAAGAVLLANDGTLPLNPGGTVAVIGDFATTPRFQGAGSSVVNARRVTAAIDGIRARARVVHAQGYHRFVDAPDPALLEAAAQAARDADVAVVFVGLPETTEIEGADRAHLRLPASHDALVDAVAAANPRTVVVLSNGAPVEMPWLRRVAAVLEGYLGGQESGGAVARMLFGELEPGGRLAETFPVRWTDHPVHDLPLGPRFSEYRESLYVGYRWFDSVDDDVAFPFGHGLGYTTFAWDDARLDRPRAEAGDDVHVTVRVTNTGQRAGSDVVQVYVKPLQPSVFRPVHELKAFAKVHLEPGESREVSLVLGPRAFSVWRPGEGWNVDPGEYEVQVAASSRDVRAVLPLVLDGERPATTSAPAVYAGPQRRQWFDRASFEALLGRPVGENRAPLRGEFDDNTPLSQIGRSRASQRLREVVGARFGGQLGDDPAAQEMVRATLEAAPPRLLRMFGQGKLTRAMTDAFLDVANGKPAAAVTRLWNSFGPSGSRG